MALIICPECNKQISDKANICVGCGAPVVIDLPQPNFKSDTSEAEEISTEDHTSLNTSNLTPKIDNSNLDIANSEVKRGTFKTFFLYLLVSFIIIFLLFLLAGGPNSSITQIFETTLTPPTNNTDYKNIIGNPFKVEYFEVAEYDFPEKMNWDNAKRACDELGSGWRLPTDDELYSIYKNKDINAHFSNDFYWSSKEKNEIDAWARSFAREYTNSGFKTNLTFVRAVRTF